MTEQKTRRESTRRGVSYENTPAIVMDPFSHEKLNELFKISPAQPDRIISRESSFVEFKESFGWKSLPKYLKTCTAYANTKGGYLVFGIGRKPHKLLGLSGSNLKAFEDIDPEKLSGQFNEHFAPEILWDIHEYELEGKKYGLLYTFECKNKPVICRKDAETVLKEGDIYYRYRGRSERIKYSELTNLLEEKRNSEQRLWMGHLERIARIGVRETGIFDLKTGVTSGVAGSFLIDEALLSQLSFIKEGEFSEVKGKPTLKIIGSAEVASGSIAIAAKRIVKTKGIRLPDIVLAFLKLESVDEPLEYIKQICFEATGFLPVYYFMHLAKIDREKALAEISAVPNRSQARNKLLERLKGDVLQSVKKPGSDTRTGERKKHFVKLIMKGEIDRNISGKELEYCLQAIRMLDSDEIRNSSHYVRDLLRTWFNKHYSSATGPIADNLRRAICWTDEALYGVK